MTEQLCPNQGEHSTTRLALHPDGTPMISIGPAVDLSKPSPALDPEHSRQCMAVPSPAAGAEALAVRPMMEQIAAMGDRIGQQTVGQIMVLSQRAAAWLRENPPGQPVAIEPRGCPTPGACSCVAPAPPAAGEVAELVEWLRDNAQDEREMCESVNRASLNLDRAAELLERQQPQPVPVSERLPGPEDCDALGDCWWYAEDYGWELQDREHPLGECTHWLPANAIPLPTP